ncbi:MAG: hypothetical protein Q4P78_05955 [Rothia sp. (in: high G+C Gram-positive bacteria)]|uniref:hypothetical protein n=1 Tax=Rothia sp. (in: high G+C Gram-positive bacteria) TaxID=1885016 RepID=UPI0026DF7CDF|nr:hypothetical protein [Rothia sp. (in: high G+C Gram-positive bacteria)]MDO5750733.1 hypothetical protein [Rothia sp. (in: high G+C Gram-positive bacteria)]
MIQREAQMLSPEALAAWNAYKVPVILAEWKLSEEEQKAFDALYEQRTLELMRETVLPIARKHNLRVDWDGSLAQRIHIDGLVRINII